MLGANTIVLNYGLLTKTVSEWNENQENDSKKITLEKRISRTLLHELCHVLIDDRENKIYYVNDWFYNEQAVLYEDTSSFGVRDTFWINPPVSPDCVTDDYRFVLYSWLTTQDVREVQEKSLARN